MTLEKVIRRTVLDNGLEVIVIENHGVPLATVELDVRNGSFTQTAQTAGLAHMYEHMFFKANGEYPDADAFLGRAGELGAVFNGSTREEVVNYYLTVPADSLVGGMRLMNAAARAPLFRADDIARERQVVLGEYDRAESSPFFSLSTAVGRKLWRDAWPRKNTIGDRAVVANTTPEQMRAIQQRYYVPNNSALIIAGDVIPDRVFALVRAVFGDWARSSDPFADPVPPVSALPANDAVIVEEPVTGVLVIRQWLGPSASKDPEATYAADVFSDVLNQPQSAFQRRLVDSGLWQSLTVNYYTLDQTGPITISGETTPPRLRDALSALDDEIARFAEPGYFDRAALEEIKRRRVAGTAFGVERASGFAHQVGFWWAVTGLDYFLGYVDNMARRDPSDLRAYGRKYIVGRPHVTGVLLRAEVHRALGLTTRELAIGRTLPRPAASGTR
ncbi:MAG: pitrilysin family protein [Gemmatimonadaceae bacterium]